MGTLPSFIVVLEFSTESSENNRSALFLPSVLTPFHAVLLLFDGTANVTQWHSYSETWGLELQGDGCF